MCPVPGPIFGFGSEATGPQGIQAIKDAPESAQSSSCSGRLRPAGTVLSLSTALVSPRNDDHATAWRRQTIVPRFPVVVCTEPSPKSSVGSCCVFLAVLPDVSSEDFDVIGTAATLTQ